MTMSSVFSFGTFNAADATGAVRANAQPVAAPSPAAATPTPAAVEAKPTPPAVVAGKFRDVSGFDPFTQSRMRQEDAAAAVKREEAIAAGTWREPKPEDKTMTAEERVAAFDAEMRAKGLQIAPEFSDVPADYKPEKPPTPPTGNDVPHNEKMAYIHGETLRMQAIIDGKERPRTQGELNLANKAREDAGLLPIQVRGRKGIDPKAYHGDLIAAGVLVPVLGAPQRDAVRADRLELLARHAEYIKKPDHDRQYAARFFACVEDGLRKGESEDSFRRRMLTEGTPKQKAQWSDATSIDGNPSKIELWDKRVSERATKIGDPRLLTLVHLVVNHIDNDGLRHAEFQRTRDGVDNLLSAIEEGRAVWTSDLDKQVAFMRAAKHERETIEKADGEDTGALMDLAKAPASAREVVKAFVSGPHIGADDECSAEHFPAEILSGYNLSLLRGVNIDVPGTVSELAEARAAGMSQEQVERIIRQRIASGMYA
jgi:hypothetical protein